MKYKNNTIIIFYILLAFSLTVYILGINNLSLVSINWLAADDVTADLLSWKFFKNDIWRFPLGNNPNHGLDIGSGIAFSGSIPIMALIFKLFANVLPDNFHYFGIWIFICFFLQSYIAFLIIYNRSENLKFSIVGSLFFLLSPILINRLGLHLSLCAHWLILMGFYLETKKNLWNKNIYWTLLISISSLIHFYFTLMLLGIFFLFFFNELKKKFSFKIFFNRVFLTLGPLIFTMFIIGYFDVPVTDALAYGYGDYTLDVSSIFNHNNSTVNEIVDWSILLPNTNRLAQESFAYLGLGGILLLIFLVTIFISNFKAFLSHENFFPFLLIAIIFSSMALSNKIYLFGEPIFTFEIPKILYGMLSIVRASGRLFWPVYYLIFLGSIILIYEKFSKKNSFYLLLVVFFIQLVDISPGLKKHFDSNGFISQTKIINYSFWDKITEENPILRTTYLNNESKFGSDLREVLLLKNIKSTDISTHGRYNRKQASISRSKLYKSFSQKLIPKNIIFAIDNPNHLRNLKYLFEKENIGFFLQDNYWFAVSGYKDEMSKNDKIQFKKYVPLTLRNKEKINFNFYEEDSIRGFGWTHSILFNNKGMWTEGNISNLLFNVNESVTENFTIKIKLKSLITKKNEPINFAVMVNDSLVNRFSLKNINELNEESIFIKVNKSIIEDDTIYIQFKIDNPTSKLDLFKSPDARNLGILVETLEIINNK